MTAWRKGFGKMYLVEYHAWTSMIQRCCNPRNPRFAHYGGRGIAVCSAWLVSFLAFYGEIGPRQSPAHSIDRMDNATRSRMWATVIGL
jgi:hypothetical protein